MEMSSTYQHTLEMGRTEGERLGRMKGACLEARKLLLLLGEDRFGAPDANVRAAVEAIEDVARLEELLRRQPHVGSWQELLPPASPSRRGRRRSS